MAKMSTKDGRSWKQILALFVWPFSFLPLTWLSWVTNRCSCRSSIRRFSFLYEMPRRGGVLCHHLVFYEDCTSSCSRTYNRSMKLFAFLIHRSRFPSLPECPKYLVRRGCCCSCWSRRICSARDVPKTSRTWTPRRKYRECICQNYPIEHHSRWTYSRQCYVTRFTWTEEHRLLATSDTIGTLVMQWYIRCIYSFYLDMCDVSVPHKHIFRHENLTYVVIICCPERFSKVLLGLFDSGVDVVVHHHQNHKRKQNLKHSLKLI